MRNPNKILLSYNKRQRDFVVGYPRKCDANLVMNKVIGDILEWDLQKAVDRDFYSFKVFNLKDELEKRGYDITTLRFSIELKKDVH